MIASIYARQDGTIAHVDDGMFPFTPDANTTRVIQFAMDSYGTEYQHIASNTKAAFWDGANLQIDNVVYLDAAWIAARAAEIAQAGNIADAQTGLRDKVDLARTHAVTIRILFNAVLDQTIGQTAQPTRFDTLKTIIQNAPLAFRERLITDCIQELGFDPTTPLSAAQIRQATLYVRMWVTGLALLLSVA